MNKNESSAPKISMAEKLIDDKVILFENTDNFSSSKKETIISKVEQVEKANRIINLLKDVNDPWAIEFIRASENNIKSLSPTSPRKVEIKSSSGEVFSCKQGQISKAIEKINNNEGQYGFLATCDYYTCNNKNKDQILAFIPSPRSLYRDTHFFKIDGVKTELHSSGFKVFDSNFSDDFPLFDLPESTQDLNSKSSQPELEKALFVPKKYQGNSNTFKYLTNADRVNSFVEKEKYCEGSTDLLNLIKEKNSVTQTMIKDLEESELVSYLNWL